MIFDGEKTPRSLDESFDYVIVGSGAAGATAARVLADQGASLAIVEEGPAGAPPGVCGRAFPAPGPMFSGMGREVAPGRAFFPAIPGTCLGGSTVANSPIC